MTLEPLSPGATVGILGGGQLGRMLAMAAARLGLQAHVFDPDPACPAAAVTALATTAAFDDTTALTAFGRSVDVATIEFENVPTAALEVLEPIVPVLPHRQALATAQDRLTEKEFLVGLDLPVAPFAAVDTATDLTAALAQCGLPAILKTRRLGYDGKGQALVHAETDAAAALATLAGAPAVLEGYVPFDCEISVVAARGRDGAVAAFEPGQNRHFDGILRDTVVPADVPEALAAAAVAATERILTALDYVGVLGAEFFVAEGRLLVNEIAPRVHNSGHWTEAACSTDQFAQHIRAVAGWPLGDPARHADVRMENLIGAAVAPWAAGHVQPGTQVHLYGKRSVRPGRKMGHLNHVRRQAEG